jgi:protein-disulfide isomerase
MRRSTRYLVSAMLVAALPVCAKPAHSASPQNQQAELVHSAEAFIRNLFTWGPEYKLKVGPLGPSPSPDFYSVPLEVTYKDQTERATFYISKDGKEFVRGEMFDTAANPFASNLTKLKSSGDPSRGPANAPVTIVEFADFECPHCREVHVALKSVEKDYPQIRLVFKNFPLSRLHPWAETAAIGGRCAFQQSPSAFWKMHDLIFDNQDTISPDNVFDQLVDFAGQIGLNTDSFKACMASPAAKQAVETDRAEGLALKVEATGTPTLFINGRPLAGGDVDSIEEYIKFALAHRSPDAP